MKRFLVVIILLLLPLLAYTRTFKMAGITISGSDKFVVRAGLAIVQITLTPDYEYINWLDLITGFGLKYIIGYTRDDMDKYFWNADPYPEYDEYDGYMFNNRPNKIYIKEECEDIEVMIIHESTHVFQKAMGWLTGTSKDEVLAVTMEYRYIQSRKLRQ